MKNKKYIFGSSIGLFVLAALFWALNVPATMADSGQPFTDRDRCVCAQPKQLSMDEDDANETQLLESKLFHCQCGGLECVIAKGSFGGMGGRGKNYGISCVK